MLAGAAVISATLYIMRPAAEIAEPVYAAVTVDVATVVKENLRIEVQAQGTVTPLQETAILAEVKGRIIEVAKDFQVGGFVSRNEILLRIDPRDYQTSLLHAQAALEAAESALVQEKGRGEVAQREWEKLPKNSQRSPEARDLYLRKPQLEEANARFLAAQADLNTARDNLERTIIRAPYDALIRQKNTDLGQFVAPGTALADIFSVETAEVRLPIPQSKLAYLELPGLGGYKDGSAIDLYTDVNGDIKHWPAHLDRTEGVFDERSRVLYTVARIDDPYGLRHPGRLPLRIGTFVNASIEGRQLNQVVVLPRYVLRAGSYVWVVDESGHLRNRPVTSLRTGGDWVYISAGLDEGEQVSLTGLDASFTGALVEIKSATPSNTLKEQGEKPEQDTPPPGETRTAATPQPTSVAGGE
jgi:RND family efflux transporter MFP subunit